MNYFCLGENYIKYSKLLIGIFLFYSFFSIQSSSGSFNIAHALSNLTTSMNKFREKININSASTMLSGYKEAILKDYQEQLEPVEIVDSLSEDEVVQTINEIRKFFGLLPEDPIKKALQQYKKAFDTYYENIHSRLFNIKKDEIAVYKNNFLKMIFLILRYTSIAFDNEYIYKGFPKNFDKVFSLNDYNDAVEALRFLKLVTQDTIEYKEAIKWFDFFILIIYQSIGFTAQQAKDKRECIKNKIEEELGNMVGKITSERGQGAPATTLVETLKRGVILKYTMPKKAPFKDAAPLPIISRTSPTSPIQPTKPPVPSQIKQEEEKTLYELIKEKFKDGDSDDDDDDDDDDEDDEDWDN